MLLRVWVFVGELSLIVSALAVPMIQEGVVSSAMHKPFPADAGTLAAGIHGFLSSGKGRRIPGAGWVHPPEVLLAGWIHRGKNMETYTFLF